MGKGMGRGSIPERNVHGHVLQILSSDTNILMGRFSDVHCNIKPYIQNGSVTFLISEVTFFCALE